ncbi:MAG: DUF4301 family protein, partial [Mucinivorans sp.]
MKTKFNFSAADLAQIQGHGLTLEVANSQIENFCNGFPFLAIDRAATTGDGILKMDIAQASVLAATYEKLLSSGLSVIKFVPASGAATRMFKELFEYVEQDKTSPAVEQTLNNITKFAFYDDLKALGVDFSDPKAVIGAIIKEGLDYGRKPKGLLKFHKYPQGNRTAMEEHLVEGGHYGSAGAGVVNIHFTVSTEHLALFQQRVAECRHFYEHLFGLTYNINYSQQKSSTDTLAVDMENRPMRESDGSLIFRPAGHGALIENLDELNADLIFIKTVDNVLPDHLKGDTILYKKALAALAIELREQIFTYIKEIDSQQADPLTIINFIEQKLGYRFGSSTSFDQLRQVLNRPLRVCGMVRNQGEPGGGPFWSEEPTAEQTLQIAESSQISPQQKGLIKAATHFNPVDLVCSVRDFKGEKFALKEFVDPLTGFISKKSKDGRELKAQELPGLWNGAMARWNTVFVEVPITT